MWSGAAPWVRPRTVSDACGKGTKTALQAKLNCAPLSARGALGLETSAAIAALAAAALKAAVPAAVAPPLGRLPMRLRLSPIARGIGSGDFVGSADFGTRGPGGLVGGLGNGAGNRAFGFARLMPKLNSASARRFRQMTAAPMEAPAASAYSVRQLSAQHRASDGLARSPA